ncbi:MAG: YibE/F family protein [Patescibacteria group bacterium]
MNSKFINFTVLILLLAPSFAWAQEAAVLDQPAEIPLESPVLDESSAAPDNVETVEIKAKVTNVLSDNFIEGQQQVIFTAVADGQTYTVDTAQSLLEGSRYNIQAGKKVYLQMIKIDGEVSDIFLVDVVRVGSIFWIVLLFFLVVIAIGLWRGVASLVGLILTMLIIFGFILPLVIKGHDPVLLTIIGSIVILAINMHVAHGFNRQSLLAYSSTVVGLFLVWIFAEVFVRLANLSGIASEDTAILFFQNPQLDWPVGILLAGIILGAVGVLDDIAITQGEVVLELKKANPKLTRKELFIRSMRVGRHHIASTVNTLVLAYVGVAMPLLLLFMTTHGVTTMRFINEELVSEEIIRTLAGTIALVLTVPIATLFATFAHKD